jgi:hypothetical protein
MAGFVEGPGDQIRPLCPQSNAYIEQQEKIFFENISVTNIEDSISDFTGRAQRANTAGITRLVRKQLKCQNTAQG